jgi:hypothetical protein
MWRQFPILGGGLVVVGGLLFLAGLGGQEVTQLQPSLSLLGVLLAGVGGMLFQAGLIGAAVGADWRSVQKGQNSPEPRHETGVLVCGQCGETGNRVGNLYCRTCGAELSS